MTVKDSKPLKQPGNLLTHFQILLFLDKASHDSAAPKS